MDSSPNSESNTNDDHLLMFTVDEIMNAVSSYNKPSNRGKQKPEVVTSNNETPTENYTSEKENNILDKNFQMEELDIMNLTISIQEEIINEIHLDVQLSLPNPASNITIPKQVMLSQNETINNPSTSDAMTCRNFHEMNIIDDSNYFPYDDDFNSEKEDDPNILIEDLHSIETNSQNNNQDVQNSLDNRPVLQNIDNDEEEILRIEENRKRKKNNSSAWKKPLNKKRRMAEDQYIGYRRTKEGKIFHDTTLDQKVMGEKCKSKVCEKSKLRFCNTISDEQRRTIFDNYWKNMDWDQRKVYFTNMIQKPAVKRRSVQIED